MTSPSGPPTSQGAFSPEATAAFAELVARHDRGEAVDFEAEFRARAPIADALRNLHANWKRLDHLLGGLHVGESGLDELERELDRRPLPPDESTRADLERLSSPERARARYVVRERLARGGMGEIWRVYDTDLERDLAMKVIRARPSENKKTVDGALLRRFLFEARLTARLDHPGIAPVHDIGVDAEGRVFFTMPLVRGRSLSEILELAREGRMGWSLPRVLEVVLKVCDTLAYAHAQGVVHRDLKPANVMVGRFGETYVMDWGLARVLSELDEIDRGVVLGTPAYMAPEQASGKLDDVGPRSDVYSLGAILYHLLAGRMPYAEHESTAASPMRNGVLVALRAGAPVRIEDVAFDAPPELCAIARKAMARSADERYADMRAMAADLRAYMDRRVVRAYSMGTWAELRKWIGRNRTVVSVVVAATLVIVVGALWFAWAQTRSANEILQLADMRRLVQLEQKADDLWPAVPALERDMKTWLTEARALEDRAPLHARNLEDLRATARHVGATWQFDDNETQWKHDQLAELVDRLKSFDDPDPGVGAIASVTQRIEDSRRIARKSLVDAAQAWRDAIASISDSMQCPPYHGLVITPQVGLVPIGKDTGSNLWLFAHVASGDVARLASSGRLEISANDAIVLVLVPGGSFRMGSSPPDPAISEIPLKPDEMPQTEVKLVPFFIARYETTRAQWDRMSAQPPRHDGEALEPQGSISWSEAETVLLHAGLDLPTEAQWEYAARAGTNTPWWTGAGQGTLNNKVNGGSNVDERLRAAPPELLPVDMKQPNQFGLYNVLGNASEWTRDVYASYVTPPRPDTGLRITSENNFRSVRGGNWDSTSDRLRSAARERVASGNLDPHIGVRAMRAIDPPTR